MKAYKVYGVDSFYSAVCFAETPSKAKAYAWRFLDAVEGYNYTEIRARRIESLDKYYKQDKEYLDWYKDEDRLVLVKVGGFACEETSFECDTCIARKYCDTIKDYLNE